MTVHTEDLPPQIEEAFEDYVDQSYGRNIAVLPLREPERTLGKDTEGGAAGEIDRDNAHRGEVIGALIVEQIESDLPAEVFHARVDLVYEHGTRAIANSRAHSNLFMMPLWRALGRSQLGTSGSNAAQNDRRDRIGDRHHPGADLHSQRLQPGSRRDR